MRHRSTRRLTPRLNGRALRHSARRKRMMKRRAGAASVTQYHGPLQLSVIRHVLGDMRPWMNEAIASATAAGSCNGIA